MSIKKSNAKLCLNNISPILETNIKGAQLTSDN